MATIIFNFEDKSKTTVKSVINKGESILDVALDEDIGLHHNCGGVCACSTCHIYLIQGMDSVKEITDKEEDFIDRAVNPKLSSRLACQCELEEDEQIVVLVPDQSVFLGH